MNKRIRELALEAGDYVNEVYTPPVRSKTPGKIWEDGHVDWHTQFNEKFAELIVAECAKLNKKQSYELLGVIVDTEENDGFDDICLETVKRVAQYLASNALIDHFGEKQ